MERASPAASCGSFAPQPAWFPTEGYSLAELDEAGLSIEQAEYLGLPVDAGRVGSYGPNVTTLREFFRASRSRF